MDDYEHCTSGYDEKWANTFLGMPYSEFDCVLTDIDEEKLENIGHSREVEHLSPGTFSSTPFPVIGYIHSLNNRFMVPLVCKLAKPLGQREQPDKTLNIWFLVDTASPYTCISKKSLEAFVGTGNVDHTMWSLEIQDQKYNTQCRLSKKNFEFANILGADALRHMELSMIVDWKKEEFELVRK